MGTPQSQPKSRIKIQEKENLLKWISQKRNVAVLCAECSVSNMYGFKYHDGPCKLPLNFQNNLTSTNKGTTEFHFFRDWPTYEEEKEFNAILVIGKHQVFSNYGWWHAVYASSHLPTIFVPYLDVQDKYKSVIDDETLHSIREGGFSERHAVIRTEMDDIEHDVGKTLQILTTGGQGFFPKRSIEYSEDHIYNYEICYRIVSDYRMDIETFEKCLPRDVVDVLPRDILSLILNFGMHIESYHGFNNAFDRLIFVVCGGN